MYPSSQVSMKLGPPPSCTYPPTYTEATISWPGFHNISTHANIAALEWHPRKDNDLIVNQLVACHVEDFASSRSFCRPIDFVNPVIISHP